jgi:monoterpene epsilon-lactone hydrolase
LAGYNNRPADRFQTGGLIKIFGSFDPMRLTNGRAACQIAACIVLLAGTPAGQAVESAPQSTGVQAFNLPESAYLSEQSRAVIAQHHALWAAAFNDSCGALAGDPLHVAQVRECQANTLYKSEIYRQIRQRYSVSITNQRVGGVYIEVFTPNQASAQKNQKQVLINLHGGGFLEGSRSFSHLESIPVAAESGITVISVDYRQAPEARFPTASEDVTTVYRELLKTHASASIGIYGCSAGGLLAAETVAWLQKEHLPPPGAIGMFSMGASYTGKGDSFFLARAIEDAPADVFAKYLAYFEGVDPNDPLVYPVLSTKVLQGFPPSLLITASRDHAMSSVVFTHSRLSALGVSSELHVFEGLGHAFFYDPGLPESQEVYALVSHFFATHLKSS